MADQFFPSFLTYASINFLFSSSVHLVHDRFFLLFGVLGLADVGSDTDRFLETSSYESGELPSFEYIVGS